MKQKLFAFLSIAVLFAMVLGACTPAAQVTEAPAAATEAPAMATEAPAMATEAPAAATEAPAEPTAAPESTRVGGWLDSVVFSAIPDAGPAVEQLKAGEVDMYAVSADDPAAFEDVKSDPNLKYATIYGSSNQMLFNATQCADPAKFNPFAVQEIREAMNWATDRNYISQEIMDGLATPKYTALTSAFADYSRYASTMSAIETNYGYDMDKAKAAVDAAMTAEGFAKNANGKWEKGGNVATVLVLIRTEDARLEIGNYFANQLEELGFVTDRQEKTRGDAAPIWQQTDPAECQFMVYTAGWISTAISRDDGNMFIQYNTGTMQNLPAMNEYNPSDRLKEIEDKLYTNNFVDFAERGALFEEALTQSMKESWWGIWITDNTAFSPFSNKVTGAYDLAGGFASAQLFPYTARIAGQEGGELKIAQSGILVSPWNPIAGSNWTDDAGVQRWTEDFGAVYNPYTGLLMPKLIASADVTVLNELPISQQEDSWVTLNKVDSIEVPGDAWVDWDATNQKWITAAEKFPEGTTAKTKSVVTYRPELWDTKWHDGTTFSIADIVFGMIMQFDGAKAESKRYDESLTPDLESLLTHFKGVRITSTDPLTIETYDDLFSLDAENNITSWYPSYYYGFQGGMINMQSLVGAMLAEENGELALSASKSEEKQVEYTSLAAGPSLEVQKKWLDQAIADQYIPFAPTMSEYITADEAVARYNNMVAWYEAHNTLFIGTGPYFVDQVFPVEQTITLKRFEDYLFPATEFSVFAEPKIAVVSVDGPTTVVAGEEAAFDVMVTFNDEAYPTAELDKVSYILFDATGAQVGTGEAEAVADGQWTVVLPADVTTALVDGTAKLSVVVSSKIVSIPTFTTYEFVVTK